MSVRQRKWTDKAGKVQSAWVVDVAMTLPTGKIRRVEKVSPLNTKVGALEFERQLRNNLLAGTYQKEQVQAVTLEDFKPKFLAYAQTNNKFSEHTSKVSILKHHLTPEFGSVPLASIGPAEVEAFKAKQLQAGLEPKTINNQLTVLRKLLSLAVEYKSLSHVPLIRWMKAPKPEFEFLTFEEANRFLAASDPVWKPAQLVAMRTGLRLGELLELQWSDLDLTARRVTVNRTIWRGSVGPPKGGRKREVDLPDSAAAVLRSLPRHARAPYVFCQRNGQPWTANQAKLVPVRTCTRAGLGKRIGWHDLRHTFASHLAMRGAPLKVIQELMGHATIEMTMRYAHLSPDSRREAVSLLDLSDATLAREEGISSISIRNY